MSPFLEAILAPIISGGVLLIFQKPLKGQISRVSPNEKTTKTIFWVSFIAIVGIALIASFAISNAKSESTTTNNILPQKTKIQDWKEVGETGLAEGKKIADDIKKNRQEKRDAKEQKWAYQIGSGMKKANDALKLYEKLEHIEGIYIFKEKSRLHYVVQTSRFGEQELRDNKASFQQKIDEVPGMTSTSISVVDLNKICDLNEFVVEGRTGDLKQNKYDYVRCYICQ